MAAKYPDDILGVVAHGTMSVMQPRLVMTLKSIRNVNDWGYELIDEYLRSYESVPVFQKLWDRHLKWVDSIGTLSWESVNSQRYKNIKAPILLIHGEQVSLSLGDWLSKVGKKKQKIIYDITKFIIPP